LAFQGGNAGLLADVFAGVDVVAQAAGIAAEGRQVAAEHAAAAKRYEGKR
jgi:hypothetical protein